MRLFFIIIFYTGLTFGQQKPIVFYNEVGEEINQLDFLRSKDYSENLDLYFENDTIQIGILITRQKFGHLDKKTFVNFKSYLSNISDKQIDSSQNIVINYLTPLPKKVDNIKSKSSWNVLEKHYLRKLHKIADIKQFWITSPESDNLNFYHHNKINWISDKDNLFKNLFFPYDVRYGNFILIKPDGSYYYYLGEHSKYKIWEKAEKFFK